MHIRRLFQILGIGLILCGFWMAALGKTPPAGRSAVAVSRPRVSVQ